MAIITHCAVPIKKIWGNKLWHFVNKIFVVSLSKLDKTCQNLSKFVETCQNSSILVKTCQYSSKLVKACPKLVIFFSFISVAIQYPFGKSRRTSCDTSWKNFLISKLVRFCPNLFKNVKTCLKKCQNLFQNVKTCLEMSKLVKTCQF